MSKKVKEEKVKEEKVSVEVSNVEVAEASEQIAIKIVAEDNDEYLLRATAAFIQGNKDGLTRFINAQLQQQAGETVDSSISIDPNSLTITVSKDTKDRGQVITLDENDNSIITSYTELKYDSFFIVTDGGQLMAMQKLQGTPDRKIAGIESIDVTSIALKSIQKQFDESQQQKPAEE